MIADIEAEAAERRLKTGWSVMGMAAVQAQNPMDRPDNPKKKSPRTLVHAATKVVRRSFKTARSAFVKAYRKASKDLSQGGRDVLFPCWCYPPGQPFTRSGPTFTPFWDGYVERLVPAEGGDTS